MGNINELLSDRLFMAVLCAALTQHLWTYRSCAMPAYRAAISWLLDNKLPWQGSQGKRALMLKARTDELRSKLVFYGVSLFQHLLILSLLLLTSHGKGEFLGGRLQRICYVLFLYTLCRGVSSGRIPMTQRSIDVLFALVHFSFIARVAIVDRSLFLVFGPQRAMARTAAAVMYMDIRKVFIWNVATSLAVGFKSCESMELLQHENTEQLNRSVYHAQWVEFTVFMLVMFSSACTRWICDVCLAAQLDAEDAQSAVHHLLTVLCDAFIKVNPAGNIVTPTPHFRHLLRSDAHTNLQGTNFSDHLASETDRARFQQAISNAVDSPLLPTAVHVNIRRCSGAPLPAQLLFSSIPGPTGTVGYIIGIREAAQTIREAEVDAPGLLQSNVTHTSAVRHQGKRVGTLSSSSTSSASSPSKGMVELKEIHSIHLKFHAENSDFTMQQCVLDMNENSGLPTDDLPSLRHWVHSSMWLRFREWVQESMNADAHDRPPPLDFGPLILHCPTHSGGSALLVAQSMELEFPWDTQSTDSEESSTKCPVPLASLVLKEIQQLPGHARCKHFTAPALSPIHEFRST